MDLSALKSRLDKIKEDNNTSIISDIPYATSLSTFLAIYNKSKRECYKDYMKGAVELAKYLAPINIEANIPHNIDIFPDTIPDIFHDYEIQKLAEVLVPAKQYPDLNNRLGLQKKVQKTIIYLTCKHYITAHK